MLAAAGWSEIGWGRVPPRRLFYPELDIAPGKIYTYRCNWAALGVAAPRIGGENSRTGFYFSRPTYAVDRLSATIETTTFVAPHFLKSDRCEVKKSGERWRLVRCRAIFIT